MDFKEKVLAALVGIVLGALLGLITIVVLKYVGLF